MYIYMFNYIHVIMKTGCPPSYDIDEFVGGDALGDMIFGYKLLVPINQKMLMKPSAQPVQ